ncbi:hypothetical protein HK101_004889 [Irineochytrium annulatum]|nr:hypothetical protein HK101_004889 [Irineochytrium annulatum]
MTSSAGGKRKLSGRMRVSGSNGNKHVLDKKLRMADPKKNWCAIREEIHAEPTAPLRLQQKRPLKTQRKDRGKKSGSLSLYSFVSSISFSHTGFSLPLDESDKKAAGGGVATPTALATPFVPPGTAEAASLLDRAFERRRSKDNSIVFRPAEDDVAAAAAASPELAFAAAMGVTITDVLKCKEKRSNSTTHLDPSPLGRSLTAGGADDAVLLSACVHRPTMPIFGMEDDAAYIAIAESSVTMVGTPEPHQLQQHYSQPKRSKEADDTFVTTDAPNLGKGWHQRGRRNSEPVRAFLAMPAAAGATSPVAGRREGKAGGEFVGTAAKTGEQLTRAKTQHGHEPSTWTPVAAAEMDSKGSTRKRRLSIVDMFKRLNVKL